MKRSLVIALAFLLWCAPVLAADPVVPAISGLVEDVGVYIDYTSKPVTIAWDKVNDPLITKYEVLAYNMERKAFVLRGNVPQKDSPTLTVTPALAGHYIFYARSVNENESDEAYRYSQWSHSLDSASVKDGKKWWIYVYIAPPSDMVIE